MACKLVYVNSRGRGELIRFILAQAEVPYEDNRINLSELQQARDASPYGILPVFHIDGKVLSGTATIARFLAEKYGLAGSNDMENAEIFGVIEATESIWARIVAYFFETNEDAKTLMRKNIIEKYVPAFVTKLEQVAAANPSPTPWIHGDQMTYADFAVYVLMDVLKDHVEGILEKFPSVKKIFIAVGEQPNIQKWLAARPDTAT